MKILVFRMSSLGDVILATAFLENLPGDAIVDWVISSEFAFALQGHPRIRKLWVFEKKEGLAGWIRLIKTLGQEEYSHRVDLHRTLRTTLAFILLWGMDLRTGKWAIRGRVSKERLKTLFLLTCKKWVPRIARPTPYWIRFGQLAFDLTGGTGQGLRSELKKPSYERFLQSAGIPENDVLSSYALTPKGYYVVMPSSRWRTKEWGVQNFVSLIEAKNQRHLVPVILGRKKDPASSELCTELLKRGIPFRSALEEANFLHTAVLLKNSAFYLGCDTGLSHLAEAVGAPAFVIFGPTRPEIGFGPARPESRAISLSLSCAPCSKDGRRCYRFFEPYECMRGLSPEQVLRSLP